MTDTTPMAVTLREVKELVRLFAESEWKSLEVRLGDLHLVLGHPAGRAEGTTVLPGAPAAAAPAAAVLSPPPPAVAAPAPPHAAAVGSRTFSDRVVEVRSPTVGGFWMSPSPGQPPFVRLGDQVVKDQQLGIVEVMKLMNNVSAPCDGTVVEVCLADSTMVEYDQVLFRIEPDDA